MTTAIPLEDCLKANRDQFAPVVPFEAGKDKLLQFDFTENNQTLEPDIISDTDQFIHYINRQLEESGARYGIGGYAEHRTFYSRSSVFDAKDGTEPRRFHLGVDIWGKPHTRVMAPVDGLVHSHGFRTALGDYGAVIILVHNINGIRFHTLYGHLSLNSLKNIQDGDHIRKGEVFAELGLPFENGQWPPHLHFQVINDMQGLKSDYPGVCRFSEREQYLKNCPDPELILGLREKG